MSLPLVFQAGVRGEIDDAYQWYERQREGLGEEFLLEVEAALARIARDPELHAIVHREVRRGRLSRFPYSAYYRIESEPITVLAIRHAKRDPSSWRSEA
ncbi:MAG: type II toxin-antitoxin system RelE/ParE family toxin [Isosphaeraceae bacterium]|nr:type II toxin-antitoxin system RelE/ParE family toxin [Isosphaeraceae bacterium]